MANAKIAGDASATHAAVRTSLSPDSERGPGLSQCHIALGAVEASRVRSGKYRTGMTGWQRRFQELHVGWAIVVPELVPFVHCLQTIAQEFPQVSVLQPDERNVSARHQLCEFLGDLIDRSMVISSV